MVLPDSSQRLCHFFVLRQFTTKEERVDTTAEVVSRETVGPRIEINHHLRHMSEYPNPPHPPTQTVDFVILE